MVCIAAFIILAIIGIFSAKYRKLTKEAWGCVARKLTLRPCDSNFKDDVKNSILSRVVIKQPKMVKFTSIAIEVGAFLIVVLTIWSLLVAVKSGISLYVYGTCEPSNAASCSLDSSEACSIDKENIGFWDSIIQLKVHIWLGNWLQEYGDAIVAIPTRMQHWESTDYLPQNATYKDNYDTNKPIAVEVFDPGCSACQRLYMNQEKYNFSDRYNLTYIAYPIPQKSAKNGYKFKNSLLIVRYLEAIRLNPLKSSDRPVDWKMIERIFSEKDPKGVSWQYKFNNSLNNDDAETLLQKWLAEFGYGTDQVVQLSEVAKSQKVTDIIETNRKLVTDKIKTVKIPTIIFDGRRYSGVINDELK